MDFGGMHLTQGKTTCAYQLLSDEFCDGSYKFKLIGTAPDGRRFMEPFELRGCEMLGLHAQSIVRIVHGKVAVAVDRIEAQAVAMVADVIADCERDQIQAEGAD